MLSSSVQILCLSYGVNWMMGEKSVSQERNSMPSNFESIKQKYGQCRLSRYANFFVSGRSKSN